jgi:hypothetical protein
MSRVIFDHRDATRTVGLRSPAETLDLLGQSGSLPSDNFHVRCVSNRQPRAKGGSGAWLVINRWHDQRWVHQTAPARRRSKRPYLLLFTQEILCHQHLVVVATVLLESIFLQAVVQKAQARIQSPRLLIVLHHGELDEFDALAS